MGRGRREALALLDGWRSDCSVVVYRYCLHACTHTHIYTHRGTGQRLSAGHRSTSWLKRRARGLSLINATCMFIVPLSPVNDG